MIFVEHEGSVEDTGRRGGGDGVGSIRMCIESVSGDSGDPLLQEGRVTPCPSPMARTMKRSLQILPPTRDGRRVPDAIEISARKQ